ncbi:hypothetical protein KSP40_PGU018644 [Platanthera guangdongensis]|uniref:Nitrate regulatory gene2 protein n=1 Tax=Platanthera guangdongensis TaxID=2320717 RepID=A0ABR2N4C6_9ASPA
MGCWPSRHNKTSLILLCRSRKALIREAVDHRYALAAAHVSYFRGLAIVGDALLRYAREVVPPAPAPAMHVVTLPAERKNLDADGSGESSATPLSHSLSEEGSHLHLSSDSEVDAEAGGGNEGDQSPDPSPKYHYMRSTGLPNMVYYGDPSGGYVNDPNYYYGRAVSPPVQPRASSPPPPPSSNGFSWDFFNPFYSYDQFLPGYSPDQFGRASMGSSPNSSEVRAREGIPDLEETEIEGEPLRRLNKDKTVAEDPKTKDSGIGSSKNMHEKEIEELEKENKSSSGEKGNKVSSAEKGRSSGASVVGSSGEQESSSKRKWVTCQEGSSLVSERSGTSDGSLLSSDGTRDVVEALGDIKEEFNYAIIGIEGVSELLEVGKMPYRSRNKLFRVISSRMMVFIGFHISSRHLFKRRNHLAARTTKSRLTNAELEKYGSMKSGYLSSTLEKLHVWEKKLYEEVKAEERLRAIYNKKCRRLQSVDDRGSDPHKIDAIQASIRSVQTKISIAITSVDFISRRIRSIMDDELQPQLVELIQGLIKMWKLLAGFHSKQLKAIISSRNYNLSIGTAVRDSLMKATINLELVLLKWCANFDKWIGTQKAFVYTLNGWLQKWLPEDHASISLTGIRAPPVFILSHDWSEAMDRHSDAEVKSSIQKCAANMHKLWVSQDRGHKQHRKADSLSREYSAKLKHLQKEHENQDLPIPNSGELFTPLDSIKKRLDEVKEKHDETLRQVQADTSDSISSGLIPIFQSLSSFSSDTLQAYEEVRIPNRTSGS